MNERVLFDAVRVKLPETWRDQSVYTFVSPGRPYDDVPTFSEVRGFSPNVVVTRMEVAAGRSLDSVAANQLDELRRALPQMRTLAQRERTVGRVPAIEIVVSFEAPPHNTVVQQACVLVLAGTSAVSFTFSSLPAMFDEDRREFDQILADTQFQSGG